jgi:hypothetical protein
MKVDLKATSNCWICEGWSQVLFRLSPEEVELENGKKLSEEIDEQSMVYIHLSSDNNEADIMEKDESSGDFIILRMVPPGRIDYYFSYG